MWRVGIFVAIIVACIATANVADARVHASAHSHAGHHHGRRGRLSIRHHWRNAHRKISEAEPSAILDTSEPTGSGFIDVSFVSRSGDEAISEATPDDGANAGDTRPVRRVPSTAPIDLAQNTSAQDSSGKDAAAPKEAAPESYPEDTEPATEKMQQQADEWNGGAAPGKPLKPLGFAGTSPPRLATPAWSRDSDFIPIEDRWRIGFPTWDRYKEGTPGEYPYTLGHWWDPYDQNILKGDYSIFDQHTFFNLTVLSDTLAEDHRLPTAAPQSDVPSNNNPEFFGSGNRVDLQQNFILSFDLFHGDAGFKPVDWEFRFTPVFNLNYLDAQETGVTSVNTADGTTRYDSHVGIQELSFQYKLADLSEYYDVVDAKAGIQPFTSDFRGFIYSDEEPGVRFFGNYDENKYEYNAAYFEQLDKDTNSGLNTVFRTRGQHVGIANLTRQDFIFQGYDAQLDFDYNNDNGRTHYDNNGFQVSPALVGTPKPHAVNAAYFGFTGDGHIGRINVTNAFYEAVGRDNFNSITGKPENINAQMGALELSYERDWLTYKGDFFYASGDGNINSHTASGFDSIMDDVDFGAPYSYWNRQGIGLSGTGVLLKGPLSLLPDLRSSKTQGQANFVNPGILFYNAGLIAKVTPRLTIEGDVNFSQFDKVGMLEQLLHQNALGHNLGIDTSIGVRYRPLLIDNIILNSGVAFFSPMAGFKDIYSSQELYSFFTSMTFTY
jgi:hypothetical protein